MTIQQTQQQIQSDGAGPQLIDGFGRHITYVRLSVTDRCDFRCTYCMAEQMSFLPRKELLTLEELDLVASTLIARGVRKLRITGGEPLVRKGVIGLFEKLGRHIDTGKLDELTLTTNGSQLPRHARALYQAGVRRVNISLDTLNADKFAEITRWGTLDQPLDGMKAAQDAGLKVKLNSVAMQGVNDGEMEALVAFAHENGADITFIETMPLGAVDTDRAADFLSLQSVRQQLSQRWTLTDLTETTGGPARYVWCEQTGGKIGFITPMSHNFCATCNRVRLTCTGQLYMCLGHDDRVDLRAAVRSDAPMAALNHALALAMQQKPEKHDFSIDPADPKPALSRHMSVTGG
ncbi:MAG: GTP 3',8-cyclase MoaA [Alphaproteobacteria bacterium]